MSPRSNERSFTLDLTRREAWIAHAALIEASKRRDTATGVADERRSEPTVSGVRTLIEEDRELGTDDVELLRDALIDYLGDAPIRDRAPGRSLLGRADEAVRSGTRGAR